MIEDAGHGVCCPLVFFFGLFRFGMRLISLPESWRHVPATLLLRMDRFYHAQEMHEPAPAAEPLSPELAGDTQRKAPEARPR
ncbi:MAG: hypothetical protein NTY98_02755 [Verrucomicrobia bacterium]|nr:hypothetical protein [Verrucomicrobiota bacterium]